LKSETQTRKSGARDVWILIQHRQGKIEEPALGLVAEAQRLAQGGGRVVAVILGWGLDGELRRLDSCGAHRIVYVKDVRFGRFHGEPQSRVLAGLLERESPLFLLMAHSAETADLAPRLAALLGAGLVTRAVDLKRDGSDKVTAVRPVANGYLFEHLEFHGDPPYLATLLPSVLTAEGLNPKKAEISVLRPPDEFELKSEVRSFVPPDPKNLDLEEADIIVSGGRGVGKGESYDIIHEFADALGGSVSGTRPLIDAQVLPYERQIGQTGKTVTPRLLVACGISGANEYTVGMEKSQFVIAINHDPRARIFRFADLGVVGDLHEVLRLLIRRLRTL
jgi:electron transfer flavoprotein alpha subunit